jgi:uncharacterized Zn finger protein (UPF0148 family)
MLTDRLINNTCPVCGSEHALFECSIYDDMDGKVTCVVCKQRVLRWVDTEVDT